MASVLRSTFSLSPPSDQIGEAAAAGHHVIKRPLLNDSQKTEYCWYQSTIRGGRESRDLDVVQLIQACEALGVGEILLNCINQDGTSHGYDLELIQLVKSVTTLPVIASSGAGSVNHFVEVFQKTTANAALASGMFHRGEVSVRVRSVSLKLYLA